MLAGVVIIQDTDGCGEIDPSQLPNPDGPVTQEHDDLGLANPMAKGFGAQAGAKLVGREDIGDVGRRIVVTLGTLVGFVWLTMRKNGSDLYLASAGSAVLAFASSELFAAHGCAGAIGADAENIPGYGIEDRPLSLSPLGHAWSYLGNHPLDLASIDLQSGIGQQVLAGSLITARQSSRAAHPASHTGGVAVHQSQSRVQGKASPLTLGAVEISSPHSDPTQSEEQHRLGALAVIDLVRLGPVVRVRQRRIVEQFFQPASSVVLER